ncbi:PP2C family protein-serine/threonine phosphatase [Luteibacter aegosomatissinici]|uniref:PP2C family protein-serine/threonine phosphatase n=1 Tax=Luteibacter aegosomatissinici TaxID=2911539 RepID=UPI001FF9213B|nr:protein phosphatase 2C domain-containing protein [Luteibacter aegosomatissinici]UPG93122.1 protein phosphatase 2C domain-containing protein [Luteibacter aegosomatissinici]
MIEFGHGTHTGLRRLRNEDTYYADAGLGLFLVVDGMGGHKHGEVASAMARDGVVAQVTAGQSLVDAIQRVNEALLARSGGLKESRPMGTTIAAIRVSGRSYEAAWVGDSRIYRFADASLERLSHDHSIVEALVEAGELTEMQARNHPQRSVLTQALGITAPDQLHIGLARGELAPGARLLLCTDGLTDEVTDEKIAGIVARTDLAAQECVDHLVLAALGGTGRDNVTAILVRAAG